MYFLLPHLVDRSAERNPGQIAMRCRSAELDYATLARRANALAHHLRDIGVRKGDRVGILMNKSVECAIALYGIMKAGAAYVPLDPAAPPARHKFIVHDCGIRVLVSEPKKRKAIAALHAQDEVCLDVVGMPGNADAFSRGVTWEDIATRACDAPPNISTMEQDLCYILYTSGSTGVPKGIMHTHRSALAWAEVSAAEHRLSAADRISNYAPLHFDLSTLDFFAGALIGCTTVMIPEEHARLPMSLAGLLEDQRISLFYTVPFALIQLITSGALAERRLPHLRAVLFGGEPLPVKHVRHLMEQLPHVSFCNVYGPTETNGCTRFFLPDPSELTCNALPIGETYANVEAIVVDAEDKPVAPGETGELLIRAPTMMQGYWNRPDLNRSAFFEREPAPGLTQRFHRTGDLVIGDETGRFEFVGRKDRLIKTRGCRVDLDDVEAALAAGEGVDEAAVFPIRDANGSLEIHAAARRHEGAELQTAELMKHLRSRLPAYAIPVRLEIVGAFPRTSSGKIDRRALRLQSQATIDNDAATDRSAAAS